MNIKSEKLFTILLNIIFGIYIIILIWAIALKCNISQAYIDTYEFLIDKSFINRFTVYFTPPHKYLISLFNRSFISILKEEIYNILIFIPLGGYIAWTFKKRKFLYVCIIGFLTTLGFELIQYITLIGSFKINDLFMNFLGAIIGYGIYKLIFLKKINSVKIMIFNIILICIIIIFIPILFYAIINTLLNIETYINILLRRPIN